MNPVIYFFLLLIISVIVHEGGHYLAYLVFTKRKPQVKFSIWSIRVGGKKMRDLILLNYMLVQLGGVVLGYIPLALTRHYPVMVVYTLGCMMDFHQMIIAIKGMTKFGPETKAKELKFIKQ